MTQTGDPAARLRSALPGLRAECPIRSLPLFGSRIRGDAPPASNLDVLVKFDRPAALFALLALEERLAAISSLQIDLVSAAALNRILVNA
jgi:predicted nucleotidyltransferase